MSTASKSKTKDVSDVKMVIELGRTDSAMLKILIVVLTT